MSESYDSFLFHDEQSPAEREALREELAQNPERARAFRAWKQVRVALRRELEADLPDRRLLVLYALERQGEEDVLSEEEQQALEANRDKLERALRAHPSLADAVHRIQEEQADFEDMWATHQQGATSSTQQRAPDRPAASPSGRRRGVRRWAWRVGGTLAVLAFAILLALLVQRDQGMVTVTAADGEMRHIELADGSTIRLQSGSTLTYPDPEAETMLARRAELKGQAFFNITSSREQFSVETPTAITTVLGTRFGLEAGSDLTELVSVTGRVALAAKEARDRIVVVGPGQRSRVARNALPSTPVPVELNEALDWTGLFLFQATSMQTIAERLSRYYDVAIDVGQALKGSEVTGTFERNRPVQEVLQVIAVTLDAEVRASDGGGYTLAPAAQG